MQRQEPLQPFTDTTRYVVQKTGSASITRALIHAFSATHAFQFIASQPRDPSRYRALDGLRVSEKHVAVDERRFGQQEWAVLTPRTK